MVGVGEFLRKLQHDTLKRFCDTESARLEPDGDRPSDARVDLAGRDPDPLAGLQPRGMPSRRPSARPSWFHAELTERSVGIVFDAPVPGAVIPGAQDASRRAAGRTAAVSQRDALSAPRPKAWGPVWPCI